MEFCWITLLRYYSYLSFHSLPLGVQMLTVCMISTSIKKSNKFLSAFQALGFAVYSGRAQHSSPMHIADCSFIVCHLTYMTHIFRSCVLPWDSVEVKVKDSFSFSSLYSLITFSYKFLSWELVEFLFLWFFVWFDFPFCPPFFPSSFFSLLL